MRKGLEVSRSDKNWKNKASIRVIEALEEPDTSWGVELRDILRIDKVFTFKSKSYMIKRIEECESNWRTHVHINGTHCFDVRTLVKEK